MWPGKSIRKSLVEKIQYEFNKPDHLSRLVRKTILNTTYLLTKPKHHIKMWRKFRDGIPKHLVSSSDILLIRNKSDSFLDPQYATKLAFSNTWSTVSLPGSHDDLWINPEVYVDILKAKYQKQQDANRMGKEQ